MKPSTRYVCVVLIIIITVALLLINIRGLWDLYEGYENERKRHPSLEPVRKKGPDDASDKSEDPWWGKGRDEARRTSRPPIPSTTHRPSTLPPSTTRVIVTTTERKTTPSTTTTERTTTSTQATTTTTEDDDVFFWTTRIHVTRPIPSLIPVTVPRIEVTRPPVEVTRPHHPHRHHIHQHKHHPSTSVIPTTASTTTTQKSDSHPDLTIVTALIDIGRGDWWEYRRPLEKYHEFMENLLSLRNNMVIFVDSTSYDFVHKYRKNMGLMHKTKIHLVSIDDLPLSRHLPYAQKIIEDELKNDDFYLHDTSVKNHPEAKSAEYDVVVCSKSYFLYNATLEDPFNTDSFAWIDAGYGHGNQSVYPYDSVWKPSFPSGKVSIIKLTPEHDLISGYNVKNLYRRNWSVVSGGFIGGNKRSLGQLHTIVHNKFIQLIYQNKVDDDQTLMVLAINSYPHLFAVRQGDWFDAFRLYSTDAELNFGK